MYSIINGHGLFTEFCQRRGACPLWEGSSQWRIFLRLLTTGKDPTHTKAQRIYTVRKAWGRPSDWSLLYTQPVRVWKCIGDPHSTATQEGAGGSWRLARWICESVARWWLASSPMMDYWGETMLANHSTTNLPVHGYRYADIRNHVHNDNLLLA